MNEMHFLTKGKDAFIYYSLDDVCTYTCTLFMKYEEIKQIDLNEYAIFVILFCFFWTPKHLTKVDMLLFIFHNVSIEVEPSCVQGKLIIPIYILWHDSEGGKKMYSLKKNHISRGKRSREIWFSVSEYVFISWHELCITLMSANLFQRFLYKMT